MSQLKAYILGQTKNMCVSGYRPSLSLGHRPSFFYCCFCFFTIDSSHRKTNFTKSLEMIRFCNNRALQTTRQQDQTVSL